MSNLAISAALEFRLSSLSPALSTAWENVEFKAVDGVPFQQANMLFTDPENPTFGDTFFRQRGYLQVKLFYPLNIGKKEILERAELIRSWFSRGLTLEAYGVQVIVDKTPEITSGQNEDNYFAVIVRVKFFANIGAGLIAPPIPDNDNENIMQKITGQTIGALKIVRLDSAGLVWISDKDDADINATVGLTITAANVGELISIQIGGEYSDNSWSWTPGDIWLGDNGNPTQILPTLGALFRLGVAIGPSSMVIEPQLVALLGS